MKHPCTIEIRHCSNETAIVHCVGTIYESNSSLNVHLLAKIIQEHVVELKCHYENNGYLNTCNQDNH